MVDVQMRLATPTQRAKANLAKRVRKVPGVRVEPADGPNGRWKAEDMRALLRHPRAGGFRSEGSIEWPNDVFTQRRLREGSIKLASKETHQEEPKHSRQQHQRHSEDA